MSSSCVLRRFVSATAKNYQNLTSNGHGKTESDEFCGKMSGEEARSFYETVICSESSNTEDVDMKKAFTNQEPNSIKKCKLKSSTRYSPIAFTDGHDGDFAEYGNNEDVEGRISCSRLRITKTFVSNYSHHRVVNQFLKSAQEGRLRQVKDMLSSQNIHINVSDQFSWTALMCASYNGQGHVVKYLLEKGAAWETYRDSQGRTALDLARSAKHFDIAELLMSYNDCIKSKQRKAHLTEERHAMEKPKCWCSVCEQEFTDDEKVHKGSTVHLFNMQRKPQKTLYYIPQGNIGYQMMLKSGWNDDKGLGPGGAGRKFPVKTVLKRDRLGLGSKRSQQPRVTHFGANDRNAVKRTKLNSKEMKNKPRRNSRRERVAKEKKEKNWERNMRIYMNTE